MGMEILRRESGPWGCGSSFTFLFRRNCSISPSGLLSVFAFVAAVSFSIAIGFALIGAWLILPFAGLEVVALGAAFLLNGRHATDYERIECSGRSLTVEIEEAGRTARYEIEPWLARVEVEASGSRVWLRARDTNLELGRHLDAQARREMAAELTRRLRI